MMSVDRELSEYRSLYAILDDLYAKFLKRKEDIREIFKETASCRKDALTVLARANRFIRHLNGRQRQAAGITYQLGEIKARLDRRSPVLFQDASSETESALKTRVGEFHPDSVGRRELARQGAALLVLIDRVKAKLLQFDLLEARSRELIVSVRKALEAFSHEYARIKAKVFPRGVFSLFYRFLRSRTGNGFFTSRDMPELRALGSMTGFVLKIADAALI